ncbi:PAS domain-containing protein [Rhizobium sp. Root482]|uniref:PAS domain-containing protein n=1 Tax=Rhizobium sp. Root482 TaxID=1736543 RepID=UPI0006F4E724|nr:PAS domain-containing protein [Rhizobium sp. Root482]KQY22506.1 hypothetical protein ASD31_22685 [Rhizobium sp. Root482]
MIVWSHRPKLLHLALFYMAYVLGCGFAQALAIVPGITVSIWPPGGIFFATLVLTTPYSWPWWILAGCLAEMSAQFAWFHSPLPAGFLIYVGNALCAVVGVGLVNRACGRSVRLESLQEVIAFVALGAGVAPLISATVGSATLAWFGVKSQTFMAVWPLFWIGDATGILLVAPPALVVVQYWRSKSRLSPVQWLEAAVLGLIFLTIAALCLTDGYLPTPYIVMPPLLWVAVRFEFRGTAVALTLLAMITMTLTLSGDSQFIGDLESQRQRQVMLQLFLAISAFSALIVAAISRQHQQAMLALHQSVETLRERERELSQLVDMVPVHIRRLTPEGEPTFFNKRLLDFFGLNDLAQMDKSDMSRLAAAIQTFVHPDDAPKLLREVRQSLATGDPYIMKYRMRHADGIYRWVDGRGESLRDERGAIVQWFVISIDIDDEVRAQDALRESERQLRQLIDAVPALIWSTTPEGTPSYINKRILDTVGVTLEDLTAPDASRSLADVHPDDRQTVERALAHSFETGTAFAMKYRQRRSDGSHRWTEGRLEPLCDPAGRIVQWYGVCLDIDDLVTAQEALRMSERRYRDLFHYMPIGLTQIDASKLVPLFKELRAQGVAELETYIDEHPEFLVRAVEALEVEEVNRHTIEMFGADSAEEMLTPITRYWQPGMATIRRSIEARYRGEEVFQEETKVARMDGSVIDVLFTTARPGAVADKSLVGFIDITERKKAEEALRSREREFSQLVDMVPSLLWRLTPDGEPVFFSKRMVEYFGLNVGDYDGPRVSGLAAAIAAVVHPDDAIHLAEALNHSFATGEAFSLNYRLRRADGVYRWMLGRAEPLRDESGCILQWYGLCHDIDDQLQAEDALRQSKRQLEQMIDAVPINILSFAPSGKMTYTSKRYLEQVGVPMAHIDDFDALAEDVAHPEDFPIMFQRASNGFATGQPFVNRFRRRDRDGVYRWIEARAQPLRDAHGAIVQWYIASIDIEDEMRAQEALRERERFLWQLVETLPAMIYCAAPAGEPVYRSQQLREFLGYELVDLDSAGKTRLNGTLDAGVHPDDVAGVKEHYGHSLSTGEPYARRHRLRRFDGEYRWVETRAAPMRNADGAIVQWNVICLDIDAEVRAQENLRLAQDSLARANQAASLAELSASIAHEVNQPLSAVMNYSSACQRWLTAEPPNLGRAQKTLERIIHSANLAADVVSHMRALFKRSTDTRNCTTLEDVVAEARDLMAEEGRRRRIRMDVDVENSLRLVVFDRVQIQQVLVNLIRNGMDAMAAVSHDKVLQLSARQEENMIRIEISDFGRGVKFPDKIFEPFFTTKEQGMGMGLAICRSIVEAHGGQLWTEQNEPQGATFVFTLPAETQSAHDDH